MLIFGIDKFMSECRAVVNFVGNAVATLFVGKWDRAVDSDRVRKVLNREPVPALPAELDATTNPLAVESTTLDDEYHPHLHHERHEPAPPYRVDDEVRRLGPDAHTHPAPVVGDAAEPSPVLAGQSDDADRPERPTAAGQGRPS
jgi:aerobic C4-dicarboxylate transport protein